jgi:phosphopantetheinyl transferase (holo-ACP synthase)
VKSKPNGAPFFSLGESNISKISPVYGANFSLLLSLSHEDSYSVSYVTLVLGHAKE